MTNIDQIIRRKRREFLLLVALWSLVIVVGLTILME
jgi:hypothetical protein